MKSGRPALAGDAGCDRRSGNRPDLHREAGAKLGLVDQLGFVEDAVDRAIELAQLDQANVRVVKYDRPKHLIESLIGSPFSKSSGLDLGTLLDLSAPWAYYLCTWLPAVASSGQ